MRMTAAGLAWTVLLCAAGPLGAQDAKDPWTPLTVQALVRDGLDLQQSPRAKARAGRLAAIVAALGEQDTSEPAAARLLCDVYQSQERWDLAADAAEIVLKAHPDDYAMGLRWMRYRLGLLQEADARVTFLEELLVNEAVPAPLRAEGAVEIARVQASRGDSERTKAFLERALALDPNCRSALQAQLEMIAKPTPAHLAAVLRRLLEANPRDVSTGTQLAGEAGAVGLHDEALTLLAYCWAVASGSKPLPDMPTNSAATYMSALLDAGQADRVVTIFGDQAARAKYVPAFLSLLAEAARASGKDELAETSLDNIEQYYGRQLQSIKLMEQNDSADPEEVDRAVVQAASVLGWFYLVDRPDPDKAMTFAKLAVERGATGPTADLLLGAAYAAKDQPTPAGKLLEPLVTDYPLAAYFLAEQMYRATSPQAGDMLATGLAGPRSGVAWRKLRDLAKRQNVAIPPAEHAKAVTEALAGLDPAALPGGLKPQDVLSVTLQGDSAAVAMGEPVLVTVTITNTSKAPITMGPGGMVGHVVGLIVGIEGRGSERFPTMPTVILPAPRYLQPGQSVRGRAELSVGAIREHLELRPLESVPLHVEAVLSPQQLGPDLLSGLPTVPVPPVTIWRVGFLGELQPGGVPYDDLSPDAYTRRLREVETVLSGGRPGERVLAARQIGSLLTWIRQTELQRARVPGALVRVADRRSVLGLLGRALGSKAALVRSQAVASLRAAEPDAQILNTLAPVIEDPSALVRMRVVELLGLSGKTGKDNQMLRLYAKDDSTMVQDMAEAFLRLSAKPQTPAGP